MRRQPEVPRWRRSRVQPPAQVIQLKGRHARRYTAQMAAAAAQAPPAAGTRPPAAGGLNDALRATGGFRFRMHLVPFWWLAVLLLAGLGAHKAHVLLATALTGPVLGALIFLLSRHLSPFARKAGTAAAALTAALVPPLAALGWTAPLPPVVTGCWLMVAVPWLHHYRWRPAASAPVTEGDQQKWDRYMAAKKAKDTWLTDRKDLPARGRQWTVMLPAGELSPGSIMSLHPVIAGVWDAPLTEVFPEPYPDGRQSRCLLTILERDTLATTTEWDGQGVDLATGCAAIGRFADGKPARVRLLVPRDGIRHGLVAGVTGAGKTYLLDLLIRIALIFGFVPVVLDPQEGQSLPYWRDKVLYASGVSECMTMLRGIHGGMLDRSGYLGTLRWNDRGHDVRGMDFYDRELSALPPVLVIGDEFPVLLTDKQHGKDAVWMTADIAKRGRKTGVALWPVAQVPSLSELGDQVVRSMLRGANVICLRTGDTVSAGMTGLQADPSLLPLYFADGSPTAGLGYVIGPDQRQAPFRTHLVPAHLRHAEVTVPALDAGFAAAIAAAQKHAAELEAAAQKAPEGKPLSAVPSPDDDAPEGRTAADAVLAVVTRQMNRGEILEAVAGLVTGQWGRERPFTIRAVSGALTAHVEAGRIGKPRHDTYVPLRPSLSLVDVTSTRTGG